MKKILLLSVGLLLLTGLTAQPILQKGGFRKDGFQHYEKWLDREIERGRVPGAVTLIYRKGEIAYHNAQGYDNLETKAPITKDKIFYIQSMTKPIISVAFMTLYEQGLFSLSDPVSKYIPAFADLKVLKVDRDAEGNITNVGSEPLKQPIRIWHLLTHTAGFSHGLGSNEYEKKLFSLLYEQPHKTIQDRVNALLSYPLAGQPGEQWYYSAAPDVLALLIEQFSGMTCAEYLQQTIFDPLGMNETGYNVDPAKQDRVVGLHQMQEDGSLQPVPQWNPLGGNTTFGGTHGLYSTLEDYLKFGKMLLGEGELGGERIISRKTYELMAEDFIDYLPAEKRSSGQGFGLGLGVRTDMSDSKIVGSGGTVFWSGAFNTFFFVDPEEDMVAVMMMQFWPYTGSNGKMFRQLIYSAIGD